MKDKSKTPLDPLVRRKILNEALGFWGESSVEKLMLFGAVYGRSGKEGLLHALSFACFDEKYAGAIYDFLTQGEDEIVTFTHKNVRK